VDRTTRVAATALPTVLKGDVIPPDEGANGWLSFPFSVVAEFTV
jgi:hypothetical protein